MKAPSDELQREGEGKKNSAMSIGQLIEILRAYLDNTDGVVAAYLYGSRMTGRGSLRSDLDLAILLESGDSERDRQHLRTMVQKDLSRLTKMDVDLVLMNEVGEALLFEIFTKGRLIFERDKTAHRFFRALRLTRCLDFRYYQERMQRGLVQAMRSAKIG